MKTAILWVCGSLSKSAKLSTGRLASAFWKEKKEKKRKKKKKKKKKKKERKKKERKE